MEFRYRPPLWVKTYCWFWVLLSAVAAAMFLLLPALLEVGGSARWFGVGYALFGVAAMATVVRLRALERCAFVRTSGDGLIVVAHDGKERSTLWADFRTLKFVETSLPGRPNPTPRLRMGTSSGTLDLGWFLADGDRLAREIIRRANMELVGRNRLGESLYRRVNAQHGAGDSEETA